MLGGMTSLKPLNQLTVIAITVNFWVQMAPLRFTGASVTRQRKQRLRDHLWWNHRQQEQSFVPIIRLGDRELSPSRKPKLKLRHLVVQLPHLALHGLLARHPRRRRGQLGGQLFWHH